MENQYWFFSKRCWCWGRLLVTDCQPWEGKVRLLRMFRVPQYCTVQREVGALMHTNRIQSFWVQIYTLSHCNHAPLICNASFTFLDTKMLFFHSVENIMIMLCIVNVIVFDAFLSLLKMNWTIMKLFRNFWTALINL